MLSLCLLKRMIESTAITVSDHANGHPSESVDGYAAFLKTFKNKLYNGPKRGGRMGIRERMLQQVM